METEALILGLDGVILDTEAAHLEASNGAFASCGLGLQWSLPQLRQATRIWGATNALAAVIDKLALPVNGKDASRLMQEKHRLFRDAVLARRPELNAACVSLMQDALERGCKLAVVTDMAPGTTATLLDQVFGSDVTNRFAAVVGGADFTAVTDNGPHHLALRTMGVEARACVAIDSGAPGLRAAQGTGIGTVAVGPYDKDIARISGADVWCPQWKEMRHWMEHRSALRDNARPSVTLDSLHALRALRTGARAPVSLLRQATPARMAA
ncbi:MAG TPA: HAD family hydrolase [Noviherbaspirillum sp.]|uniref:HAD family hydrolase n=1 Tax=Noviherbaspirillum sp. TaxID=1926288 RepID=UPI002B481B21|nr:HAD family hydrolase [Noviherbaspirillum sp.]HJV86335.1 HAD family hydrolase [Noviherbaspirillum sp.]